MLTEQNQHLASDKTLWEVLKNSLLENRITEKQH